ncbi:MAG: ATP-binding protein [Dysgonamonadaceae bacterium]|jgi:AAA+ ATPase superfamily predicted ATPase|nr:ATP-binding protein [Dysgonamonadaceae bacterium]
MKFYNREKEIALLQKIEKRAQNIAAQMTFIVGRRRIGKTSLLAHTFSDALYFFVSKKNETLLCEEYIAEIQQRLGVTMYGDVKNFKDIFAFLMDLSQNRHFTLIIDEFQGFMNLNKSIYSDMQNIWDAKKGTSKINLVLSGSVYSLMKKIFENSKEPLFGRATARIHLKSFNTEVLKAILNDYKPDYTKEDLLAMYLVTGGVAKYVELLVEAEAFDLESIIAEFLSDNSIFLEEGKNLLVDEFGKDYSNYFSILTLIATSKNQRTEMEDILGIDIGGYLDRLENEFGLIEKNRPIFAKPTSRSVKYRVADNFLNFWFRFIYKYRGAVEMEKFDYLKDIIFRDYKTYSGAILERYFRAKLSKEENLSQIGAYWESGNRNEIDIIAINEYEKTAIIAEVKRKAENISLNVLQEKAKNLVNTELAGYKIEYKALSMNEM